MLCGSLNTNKLRVNSGTRGTDFAVPLLLFNAGFWARGTGSAAHFGIINAICPERLDFFPFVCKIEKEVYKAERHCDLKGKLI
jgi:hypothetical protein